MEMPEEVSSASRGVYELEFAAEEILGNFAHTLEQQSAVELLIGFPAAPFILPLATRNKLGFLRYAAVHPSHSIHLRRAGEGVRTEWVASPLEDPKAYEFRFTLPRSLEDWINESERRRLSAVKRDFLSAIMIYYQLNDGVRACQLKYEPGSLGR
jgi:hypothetical protein